MNIDKNVNKTYINSKKIIIKKCLTSLIYNNFKRLSIKKIISINKYKIINVIFYAIALIEIRKITTINNISIVINDIKENKTNNEGYFKINTIHKSNFSYYNYSGNIIVYKDLYKNISYTPITKINSIVKTNIISNETYFKLCEKKVVLDDTKYKRNLKPKISVIIPYYNKDKFSLFIPLRSIQNQSFKDIEIIFVDDGSPDNKLNEIFEEMKKDNRIILLKHKENKGTLMSRADGVRFASGEYILNLDQDDLYINNLFFEIIYKKIKELNVDILQFSAISYENENKAELIFNKMPSNRKITQPELKIAFLKKIGEKRLGRCNTRMIWDKMIKREVYLKAIEDLGDEYLNHRIFIYEDTLMIFELSQIANSYYFYDIFGYRLNRYNQGKARDMTSNNKKVIAMNQLYFIKLLLYKISPIYDRYYIFKEWGFEYCGSEVYYLDKIDINLLQEVIEIIDELERIYKNTAKKLLKCTKKIKRKFGLV